MKKSIYSFLLLISVSAYAAQVHNMVEGKRIEASICPTELNRISITGDRISQVFGSDDKFNHQVDEEGGQLFLKPLSAQEGGNPHTPVSLTVITESGITQDLTLHPKEKMAATILLKSGSEVSKTNTPFPSFEGSGRALPYQEVLIQTFRTLANETGRSEERSNDELLETPSQRTNADGVTAYFVRQLKGPQHIGQVFEITNSSSETITVQEKQFFQNGDMALALTQTTLAPQETVKLYVIRRGL